MDAAAKVNPKSQTKNQIVFLKWKLAHVEGGSYRLTVKAAEHRRTPKALRAKYDSLPPRFREALGVRRVLASLLLWIVGLWDLGFGT
jgi:hypothetical protein